MKIFGYEFRKFEEETTTLESVETWVVEWWSLHKNIISNFERKSEFKTFIDKEQAELFKDELENCIKLLGDDGRKVALYKQKNHTNMRG